MNAFHYERYRLPNLHNPFCLFRAALFSPILRRLLFRGVYLLIFVRGPTPLAIGTKKRARVIERTKGEERRERERVKRKQRKGRDGYYQVQPTGIRLLYLVARFIVGKTYSEFFMPSV